MHNIARVLSSFNLCLFVKGACSDLPELWANRRSRSSIAFTSIFIELKSDHELAQFLSLLKLYYHSFRNSTCKSHITESLIPLTRHNQTTYLALSIDFICHWLRWSCHLKYSERWKDCRHKMWEKARER